MIISKRLKAIANFVPQNSILGDIGTDHGYLPVYLIENNISKKVIATDISKNSLEKTIDIVKVKELKERIDTRLGDGLEVIRPFEIDTVVISGMGGLLIIDILEGNKDITNSITNFIFQPNIASKELREYLYENSFEIIDEKLVYESNKFYETIYAKRGKSYLRKDIYLEIGEQLIINKDPLLAKYIKNKINLYQNIIKELKDKDTEKSKERHVELTNKTNNLKEVLAEIECNRDN